MADAQSKAARWYANITNPAIKAAVVELHWEVCFGNSPTPVLQGALSVLQHTASQHAASTPSPDVDFNDVYHEAVVPSGPNGPYTTYWFSRALSEEEKEAIGRAYALVESKLQP